MTEMTLSRRHLLAGSAAIAATTALPAFAQMANPTASGEDGKLLALFDAFFNEGVDESPEQATSLGLDKGARAALKGQLSDQSQAGQARRLARTADQLKRLNGVDRAALSASRQLDYDVVEFDLKRAVASSERFRFGSARGNFQPYVISQQNGPYTRVPDFLDAQHRITNTDDAEAYLSRLSAYATALDDNLAWANADAAKGVIAPDFALDLALSQLEAIRGTAAADTVLVTSMVRKAKAAGLGDEWGQRANTLVEKTVFPAYDRYIAGVRALRAKASSDAGVWKLPDSAAYYDAAVKSATTTNLTPEEVHQLGLAQVADITAQLDTMLKAQGLTQGSVGARLVALSERPDQVFPNTDAGRADVIKLLNEQVKDAMPRLQNLFITLPKADIEVRRVPAFIQDGAANGYYQGPAPDGSRPGAFYINLKDTAEWPRFTLATLTYHEAVPGHHMQVAIAQESPDIPMLRRRGGYSAYSEGWALYAEQVADELGVYAQDPLGRIGYLQSFLFRAARLVADTGLHHKRWSRDKATQYFVDTLGYAKGRSQREIERYCVNPGQALSYKIGHMQWAKLRDAVRAKQGADFDPRKFHEILRAGAMPLVLLEREVMRRA
ncbi:DUF885 domain-containing protein [Sandarakinorhabdus sp.]|uniref:DUF885 domain-containing protein n=1 Tax=Sandarakinorhabdus sp. TaxID=1916663 RepID=UPI003F6EC35D